MSRILSRLLFVATSTLASCAMGDHTGFLISVKVAGPWGVREGSAVWLPKSENTFGITPTWRQDGSVGEAVAVDLPRRLLLVLRSERPGAQCCNFSTILPATLHSNGLIGNAGSIDAAKYLKSHKVDVVVPPSLYPDMAVLTDPKDPTTIQRIDPDNKDSGLGPNVRIEEIRIKSTRSEPSLNLADRLPWLADMKGRTMAAMLNRFDDPRFNFPQWSFTSRRNMSPSI